MSMTTDTLGVGGLERHLRESVAKGASMRLPSLRQLAGQFDLPLRCVQAVVRKLRTEGLVRAAPGRGITIAQRETTRIPAAPAVVTAEETLYRTIRSRIESGAYRTGQALPKTAYVAASERVGTRVVGRVYRALLSDGLVYANGRALVVGSRPHVQPGPAAASRKSILIVQLNDPSWEELAQSWWTQPFALSFLREMSLYGLEPVTVLLREIDPGSNPTGVPAGRTAIARTIKELGSRLAGILVVNMGESAYRGFDGDLMEVLVWLCTFDRTVVSLDPYAQADDRYVQASLPTNYESMLTRPAVQRRFVRCFVNNRESALVPLTALHGLGHRCCAFLMPTEHPGWMESRLDSLRRGGRTFRDSVRIIDAQEARPVFRYDPGQSVDTAVRALREIPASIAGPLVAMLGGVARGGMRCSELPSDFQSLLRFTEVVAPFIEHPDVTALIAPNDEHARHIYRWLSVVGIRVPQDVSLISFDDRQEMLYPYTISSVNFGFDALGYTAFHIILGDIPVKVDKRRSLAATCRINHYASMGPARRVRAPAAFLAQRQAT